MKRYLLLSLILFFCTINAAFSAILTCTHSPQNITLAPGGSEVVTYNCTTPIPGQKFQPGFKSSSTSITTTEGTPVSADYQATVSALSTATAGVYTVSTAEISVAGGGYVQALDATSPLQVTVQTGPTFTITPSVTGGNGAISPSTAQEVASGSSAQFTATPNTGYSVSGWNVDGVAYTACSTNTTCTLSDVTANHTISVSFTLLTYTITPTGDGNETISPSSQAVTHGNTTTFTVTPSTNYTLGTPGGTCPAGSFSGSVYTTGAITGNCTLTFSAALNTYTITPTGDGNETISPSSQTVTHGNTTTFTVVPTTGYTLETPGGTCPAGSFSGSVYTTGAIISSCTLTFSATINGYTVTPSGDGHETITPSTPQTVNHGSTTAFTVTPDTGYTLGTPGGTCPAGSFSGSVYTTGAITSACTVTFNAALNTYLVTPTAGANGSISPSTPQTVSYGGSIAFTATPNSGYSVAEWVVNGVGYSACGTSTSCTVSNITQTTTVAVSFSATATGVVGILQTGTCATTGTVYPQPSPPISCVVLYTNNTGATINNPTYAADIVGNTGGSIVETNASGTCNPFNVGAGADCHVTYTYTPAASTVTSPQLAMSILSGPTTLATVNQTVTFAPPITVLESAPLTCTPTSVIAGGTSACTLTLNNAGPSSTYTATITPSATHGTFVKDPSGTVSMVTGANPLNFNYTAPSDLSGATEDTLSVGYADDWSNQVTIAPVTILLRTPITTSGIRCFPEPATPGALLTCTMFMTNVSSSTRSVPGMTASIGGTTVSTTTSCSGSLVPNTPCTITFSRTLPSGSDTVVTADVSPTVVGTFTEATADVPIAATSVPNIQSNPLVCQDTTLAIGGASTTCSITFRNSGTASATNVILTPTVAVGSTSGATMTCSNATLGTMATNDTCSLTFTYTSPVSAGAQNFATISVSFADTQTSYAAFPSTFSILLSEPNAGVTASVIPNASNELPLNNVEYAADATLTVIFHFINNTGAPITFDTPIVEGIVDGTSVDLAYAIDTNTADSSCLVPGALPDQSGCNLQVNFTPYQFDGFSIGNQVALAAWLPLLTPTAGVSSVGTWSFSIGDPPIFAAVNTNQLFVDESPGLVGMFLFGNGTSSALTDLRSPRLFLPPGFSAASDSTCTALLTNYPGAQPCSNYTGSSLAPDTYCYACFQVTGGALLGDNQLLEGQLSSDQSIVTAERTVPVTPSYRTLTLVNACQAGNVNPVTGEPAGTIWPAFVSGAAYYYCSQDSDCPLNSACYVAGHQCMTTATTPSVSGSCPTGSYPLPASGFVSTGCSTGCVSNPAVCPSGSTCNASNALCYWSLPTATTSFGSAVLTPGSSVDMQIPNVPLTKAGDWSTVWSGGLVPRTGCYVDNSVVPAEFKCDTGYCPVVTAGTDNSCSPGVGPLPPATQAEFTFLYNNQDYYDVEIINGFSIPASMKPTNSLTLDPSSPYTCNVTGEKASGSPTDECTWDFTMKTYNLTTGTSPTLYTANVQALHTLVAGGTQTSCTPASSVNPCTSGEVCGLSQLNSTKITGTTAPLFTCGQLVGGWSSNQLCGSNPTMNYTDPDGSGYTLNCSQTYGGNTLSEWFGCNGTGSAANSCYSANAASGCCGCPYWSAGAKPDQPSFPVTIDGVNIDNNLIALFSSPFTLYPNANNDYCQAYSESWMTQVYEPSLIWMKQACTSLYTFPYDDATSTFTCSSNSLSGGQVQNPAGKVNTQNYTITFCPSGYQGTINQPGSSTEVNDIIIP
ncbi:MAG: thaumatin family protein [Coxiellaceae bacterium]|nr:thaumatin family protein [Coxiellaceae bacterium]